MYGIPDLGLCNIRKRDCAQTSVLGLGFVEKTNTLSCGIKPFYVSMNAVKFDDVFLSKTTFEGNIVI